jgi:hypothetical protein
MIVQEDVPYTKEEVKAMVKTIHDMREKLSLLGWHPASEPPEYAQEVIILFKHGAYHDYPSIPMRFKYLGKWFMDVKWWCYPPKED